MSHKKTVPQYRRHANGQAFAQFKGRRFYLGKFGTSESKDRYTQFLKDIAKAPDKTSLVPYARFPGRLTINGLIIAYLDYAETYYRGADGKPTSELTCIKYALRPLAEQYGAIDAIDFDTVRLEQVREKSIERNLSRGVVNNRVGIIRRVFKWAARKKLLPSSIWHDLRTVEDLRFGRTSAREAPRVLPVDDSVVELTLPYLPPIVADMVRIQRLTGCRPGEVRGLRPRDVDRSNDVWAYRPLTHKTKHHGHERTIFIGPRAQAILQQYFDRPADAYCFSPAQSERVRLAELHLARTTPLQYGNRPGSNAAAQPRKFTDHYSKDTFNRSICHAVDRANCERLREFLRSQDFSDQNIRRILNAVRGRTDVFRERMLRRLKINADAISFVTRWRPNQLRHTAGTDLRERFGVEASRVVLGHKEVETTQIYAERDLERAAAVMRELG